MQGLSWCWVRALKRVLGGRCLRPRSRSGSGRGHSDGESPSTFVHRDGRGRASCPTVGPSGPLVGGAPRGPRTGAALRALVQRRCQPDSIPGRGPGGDRLPPPLSLRPSAAHDLTGPQTSPAWPATGAAQPIRATTASSAAIAEAAAATRPDGAMPATFRCPRWEGAGDGVRGAMAGGDRASMICLLLLRRRGAAMGGADGRCPTMGEDQIILTGHSIAASD
eukprot:351149-Chlamydomonas_euryale.AAC.5